MRASQIAGRIKDSAHAILEFFGNIKDKTGWGVSVAVELERLDMKELKKNTGIQTKEGGLHEPNIARTAVEVLESAGEIPGLASLKLCPYCLISSLLGLPRDLNYSGKSRKYEDSDYDVLVDKLNSILALGATAGWLKAAAALHNKEVHALNGNIDSLRVVRNTGERPKVVEALRNVFWYSPVFSSKRGATDRDLFNAWVHMESRSAAQTTLTNSYETSVLCGTLVTPIWTTGFSLSDKDTPPDIDRQDYTTSRSPSGRSSPWSPTGAGHKEPDRRITRGRIRQMTQEEYTIEGKDSDGTDPEPEFQIKFPPPGRAIDEIDGFFRTGRYEPGSMVYPWHVGDDLGMLRSLKTKC
ncbi:hypothetical protein RUM44_005478 [Polyplax serrata]|uniref:Uncharacterized protein n=1 Tax=Polyplax serrata TaxID=468196 RepID=A0ABR1AW14_POLSC